MPRSMLLSTSVLALALAALAPSLAMGQGAAAPDDPSARLLESLALVPDTPEARSSMLSWVDQEAVVAARVGAADPASMAELQSLLDAGDPGARLWLAAYNGISSGDPDILGRLGTSGEWPEILGFDALDIDRHLVFATPPSDGSVLLGSFDPEAIATAFAERGYTATSEEGRTLLCGPAGCESGLVTDIANTDPGLPFGAHLGRKEPIAVSECDILSSADSETLESMLATARGEAASLADDPAYRALATVADPGSRLLQASVVPGTLALLAGPDISALLDAAATGDRERGVAHEPMPAPDLIAVLDTATAIEQVLTIALAYADEASAAVAAEVLPRRLETVPTLAGADSLSDLLAARGVSSIVGSVVPPQDGMPAVARIELRAPLAGDEPDPDSGLLESSSGLYRLFTDLILRRDLLWLAPG